jgi:hypothetical protein
MCHITKAAVGSAKTKTARDLGKCKANTIFNPTLPSHPLCLLEELRYQFIYETRAEQTAAQPCTGLWTNVIAAISTDVMKKHQVLESRNSLQ